MATKGDDPRAALKTREAQGNSDDEDRDFEISLRDLRDVIERHYSRFIADVVGLESPQAQVVILALVSQRLAVEGLPLGGLLKCVARAYGVDLKGLHIVNTDTGEILVRHEANTAINEGTTIAPGSKRNDN